MKSFLSQFFRFSLYFAAILLLPAVLYLRLDPYRDLDRYTNYSWEYNFQMLGDLNTKKLLRLPNQHNSFIFGSSRTGGLYACYLNKIIPGASFYQYANWSEKIEGIEAKLALLQKNDIPIKNAVIYLDTDYTFKGSGQIHADDHFLLTGKSCVSYYIQHFFQFYVHFNSNKLKILFGKQPEKKFHPNWHSDVVTNDMNHTCADSLWKVHYHETATPELTQQIDALLENGFFYQRPEEQQYAEDQISPEELKMLEHIRDILEAQETNFYVVITPIYDQVKFSEADKSTLQALFGERLYDYSGINELTENPYHYRRDRKHFRPFVSYRMANEIILGEEFPSSSSRGSIMKPSFEN